MSLDENPKFLPVPHIDYQQLVPGLIFTYEVGAEKGPNGDFPGRFPFELHGRWAVEATVIRRANDGALTVFEVFEDDMATEVLRRVEGNISPRLIREDLPPEQYGRYAVEEGMYTPIAAERIDGEELQNNSSQRVIPARNIQAKTLKIARRMG